MSSGKVHHGINRIAIVPVWFLSFFLMDTPFGVGLFFGAFFAVFITPDTDFGDRITYGERKLIDNFGALGHLVVWWWRPYGMSIPHRHFLSHGPIISTFVRAVYVFAPILFHLFAFRKLSLRHHLTLLCFDVLLLAILAYAGLPIYFIAGFFCGALPLDLLHFIADS